MNIPLNPRPKKGVKYGCWTLMKLIGEGGNGFVFLAKDEGGREVAIKILAKLEGKSQKVYERFKREVKIIQENSDIKGILPIIDSYLPNTTNSGFPWYVMPIAEPLEDFLAGKNIEGIVLSVLEIGKTLIHLHHRGISHRDIKPANILVREGNYFLADFGLAHTEEDGIDLTSTGEQLGAKWTIAPEMKRESQKADGRSADVYSLAKTLWILITGKKYGFDGQYDAESVNGLKNFNLYVSEENGFYFSKPRPMYLKPLDDLIRESTTDNPSYRPSIDMFISKLTNWLVLYKDYKKRNPLEWRDVQTKLFPFSIPNRAVWENLDDIVLILNYLFSVDDLNHVLLPDGGGLDFEGARIGLEKGTLELIMSERNVYIVKPKKIIFENIGGDWEWNYFRLETGDLEPIEKEGVISKYCDEDLVEILPLQCINRRFWDEGEYEGEEIPKSARLVSRYKKGDFVIFQKTSTYNKSTSTYDGRHNQMSTDEFRNYIAEKVKFIQQMRLDVRIIKLAQEKEVIVDEIVFWLIDRIFHEEYLKNFSGRSRCEKENINEEA